MAVLSFYFLSQPQDGPDREAGEHPVSRHQPLHPESPASLQAPHGGLRDPDTLHRRHRHHQGILPRGSTTKLSGKESL